MPGGEPGRTQNAAVVRRLFEAFAARDAEALLELVAPEIEFFGPTAMVLNEGRCYRGHEGMKRYMRDAQMLWEELRLEPRKLREVGNHVVVLGRVRALARDGLELDTAAAWVWRVEHGRVTWGCAYGDPDQMPTSLQESARPAGTPPKTADASADNRGGAPTPL
jgi:ketosteroid isomerase-like protein